MLHLEQPSNRNESIKCYLLLQEEEEEIGWLVTSILHLVLCQVHMIPGKWGFCQVQSMGWGSKLASCGSSSWRSPGWLCPPLVAQAGRKLALFAQRGEGTDAFCIFPSASLLTSLLPTCASRTFLAWFIHQPRLKGTFSMQANVRAMFTCCFPSESFISLQPQGPRHQPKLNMGLKSYSGQPRPSLQQQRAFCLCKCARACTHTQNQMCASRINEAIQVVIKWTIYGQFQQLDQRSEVGQC